MIHHRQRLPLGLESRNHLPTVHPRLDNLQRHLAPHRPNLLGHVHHAHPTPADLLQQLVRPDTGANSLGREAFGFGYPKARRWRLQKAARVLVSLQQRFHLFSQLGISSARSIQK